MDLFELLILFFFIVLPLLQQLLQRGKGGEEEHPAAEDAPPPDRAGRLPEPLEPVEKPARAGPDPGWSAGWGDWPEDEGEPAEYAPDEEDEVRLEPALVPEVLRVSAPVVSLEQLHVDRSAEHARIHSIHAAPSSRARSREPRIAALLGGRHDLRRAIVLSEVLGPPSALRDRPHD